jgi:hypothetical protein
MRRRYTRPERRKGKARQVAAGTPEISEGRRWTAIALGTFGVVVCFAAVVTAIVEEDNGNSGRVGTAIAFAAAMVPVSLLLLGKISDRPRIVRTVILVSPLVIVGFFGIGGLLREPATALVLAFGVGGALTMSARPEHRVQFRFAAVAAATAITLVLALTVQEAAIVLAPFLPFPAIGVADRISANRPEASNGDRDEE